jgi:S1-C subfamily serine protease
MKRKSPTRLFYVLILSLLFCFSGRAQSQADMIENSLSSVVTVVVYETTDFNTIFGARGTTDQNVIKAYERSLDLSGARGSGSGFVVERNGKKYVITNSHVIETASMEEGSIYIYSIDQTKYEVNVLGGDTFYDFAVLEFVDKPGDELKPIKMASKNPKVGANVYAIGNPLGDYPYTVTDGIISAKNRTRGGMVGKFGFLQTTATVIWGNSGGPLIDEKGEVVGINSQIAFDSERPGGSNLWLSQINFALEAEIVNRLLDDVLENDGRIRRSYFGLMFAENYAIDYYYGGLQQESGTVLSAVFDDSPFYSKFAPYRGQLLKKVDGQTVRNINELLGYLELKRPGQNTTFTFESGEVSVAGSEMDTESLTSIARNMIAADETLELEQNAAGVFLTYSKPKVSVMSSDYKFSMEDNKARGFQFIAVGLVGEESQIMYTIKSLADLGAAIRLTSIVGYMDFYGYDAASGEDKLIRHNYDQTGEGLVRVLFN